MTRRAPLAALAQKLGGSTLLNTARDPQRSPWLARIALLTGVALAAALVVAAVHDAIHPAFGALLTGGAAAALALGLFARGRGIPVFLVASGVAVVGATYFASHGTSLSLAVGVFVPFVVCAAAARGATAGFVAADGFVLAWAMAAGLAAVGITPSGATLPLSPARVFLDLGILTVLLNAAALSARWAVRVADPQLRDELNALEREREELASQLESVESLASAGRLVANVAHEISNPLQAMDNFVFVLLEETPEEDARRHQLLMLKQGIDRIRDYLDQLSDFYRPTGNARHADVNQITGDLFRFLGRQLQNANVKVCQEFTADLPDAAIPEERFRQIALNIVLNAVEAMPDGGELLAATHTDGEFVVVLFQDTGPGIPAAQLDRVFEPFFTTKARTGGTGLGLSITRRIVQSYGGEISVSNTSGIGARAMLRIPMAHGAAEAM
jgi:signal transduction histidine kinase